jgi:hypothetical protein
MSSPDVGLPEALESAASALGADADAIRPANGDPAQLLRGLDVEAAKRVLAWLLEHVPAAGGELAVAWAEESEAGAAAILAIAEDELPKPGRKLLRRVRHQLRSRGVAVPVAARVEMVASLPPVDDKLDEARITAIDPSGARVAMLAVDHPSGGARLFQVVMDEQRGVLEFEVFSTGRSQVRRFFRDFAGRDRLSVVVAPPDAVRALVARALDAHPRGRPLPRGLSEWRSRIADAPEGTATPGELASRALAEDLGAEDESASLERVAKAIAGGELGPWPPAQDALEAVARKLEDVRTGVIVVSGTRKREQMREVIDGALGECFGGDAAEHAALRLEESAYVFWKTGREEDARSCLVAARAFRERSASDNPVARAMLERVLAPVLERADEAEQGEEEPSLLVET